MPEFERGANAGREPYQKLVEDGQILPQEGRQLKQQRPKLVAERAGHLTERAHERRAILEPAVVRDSPWRLEGELEGRRGLAGPAVDELLGRHSVERVVDLNGLEPRRIVRQHLRCREIGRIEATLPFGVVVAGGADPDHGRWSWSTNDPRLGDCKL